VNPDRKPRAGGDLKKHHEINENPIPAFAGISKMHAEADFSDGVFAAFPDGIAMCQDRGAVCNETERAAR
jgi:hypothetical protein